jgi:signal transduction histidine kinase
MSFLLASIIGSIKGDRDSKLYLLAFSPLLTLSVGVLLRNNGLFPHLDVFEFNIPIGLTSEAIVFSLALAYRIQRVRTEKEQLLIELNDIQAKRFRNVIEAVENERKRIAIDLHDSLGQLLSTAKLNVSVWGDQVAEEDEENYETSMKLLDEACTEVREISYTMMPSTLIRLGFIHALKELAANINMANKMKVTLDVSEYSGRLEETKGISLYRICQEILSNAIRYSEADAISIRMTESNDHLYLFIKDNGVGFDTQKLNNSSGIGWSNIFSRISMLKGHIRVFSNRSSGTSVHIDIPL